MSVIDINLLARLARAVSGSGESYLYTRLVPVLAEGAPNSAEWFLGYLNALAGLGLGDVACELIDRADEAFRAEAAVVTLRDAVSRGRSSRVEWSGRRRRFEANLAALAKRDAELADRVSEAWSRAGGDWRLHQCSDGNHQVRPSHALWPPSWWCGLDDHRGLSPTRINAQSAGIVPPPMVFEGVGLGWEILEAYKQTDRVFLEASSVIYIFESRAEAVAIAFHLHDWREILADERVRWFVGGDRFERFGALLRGDSSWPLTDRCCRNAFLEATGAPVDGEQSPDAVYGAGEVLNSIGQERLALAERLREEITHLYAERDADWWATRFGEAADERGQATGRPLRVLGFTSRHTTFLQYSMRDCLSALESLGHETKLLIEPDTFRAVDPIQALTMQREFQPDVILILSRMRYEMPTHLHESIPTVSWDQDALPWVLEESRNPQLAWNDFLMGMSAVNARRKFGWPEHRCKFVPMAGGVETYSDQPVDAQELEPYRCDVSYVSHASAPAEVEADAVEGWLPDEKLRAVYRAALPALLTRWKAGGSFTGPTLKAVLDSATAMGIALTYDELAKVNLGLLRVGDRVFRHVALAWAADWADRTGRTFRIWGNGWESHERLVAYAQGPAENGDALRRVYQASTINLQLTAYGFLHQRAFDGVLAGGFFMARRSAADVDGPRWREMADLMEQHGVCDARSLAAVGNVSVRARIEGLMAELFLDPRVLSPTYMEFVRFNASNVYTADVIADYESVTFDDAHSFAERAERFLADADERAERVSNMRRAVVERFSYASRMGEMVRFLADGFLADAASQRRPVADLRA